MSLCKKKPKGATKINIFWKKHFSKTFILAFKVNRSSISLNCTYYRILVNWDRLAGFAGGSASPSHFLKKTETTRINISYLLGIYSKLLYSIWCHFDKCISDFCTNCKIALRKYWNSIKESKKIARILF